eukprot:GEMP01055755.1.p1 GENE.GEMP01055755.1~~GEMP01055755.1.p1  ORF type:complete len:248 (+),score=57.92 GEMP01055755.1:122-865(+)
MLPLLFVAACAVFHLGPDRPKPKKDSVEALTDRLAGVVNGLGSVKSNPKNTEFSKVLAPYVEEMSKVLTSITNSKKPMSEKEKRHKLEAAQNSMEQLADDMAKFGQHLIDDDASQNTSILLGVLLARKDEPMERQMEVLQDKQFQHLAAVKYVLENRTSAPLVAQVADFLDNKKTRRGGGLGALRRVKTDLEEVHSRIKDNIQFVQLVAFTRNSRDCPYCKAQCIEKCHSDGESFMSCIGSCAHAGQ